MCDGEVDDNLLEVIEEPIPYLKSRRVAIANKE
jgi:hypothetical protein